MASIDPDFLPPRPKLFPYLKERRKVHGVLALGGVLLLEAFLALIPFLRIREAEHEIKVLALEKTSAEQKLETMRSRLSSLEQELAILVQTRSPELYRFELDRIIPINRDGLENVRLTQPPQHGGNVYFVSVLAAPSPAIGADSAVKLAFFDSTGVQISGGRLAPERHPPVDSDAATSGQLLRFSGWIALDEAVHPAYFSIAPTK